MKEFIIKIDSDNLVGKINRLGWYCDLTVSDKNALLRGLNELMKDSAYFVIQNGKLTSWTVNKAPKIDLPVLELTGYEKQRIFFDLDGTVAEWGKDASLEEVFSPGYFSNRPVMENVRDAMNILIGSKQCDVYVLSARDFSLDHTKTDKDTWVRKELPMVDERHVIYSQIGEDKIDRVPFPRHTDTLVDDYNVNLNAWYGTSIKMLNGINSPWDGLMVSSGMRPDKMAKTILMMAQAG